MAQWKIDSVHSSVEFSVMHLGVSWVRGRFSAVSGNVEFDPENPEKSSWDAQIETKSVWTGNEMFNNHLMSTDFFDTQKYPAITFKSTSVEKGDGKHFSIKGILTMKGVQKPVTFEAEYIDARPVPAADGKMSTHAGFLMKTTVNRHDFGVSWDKPAGDGVATAGAQVHIRINVEVVSD